MKNVIIGTITFLVSVGGVTLFIGGMDNTSTISEPSFVKPTSWYYVTPDYQCVQVPKKYLREDECASAVGAYCDEDPTCGGIQRVTFYYINADNKCILAPHNPYPATGIDIDGTYAEEEACIKDVGKSCFSNPTCNGVLDPGTIVMQGDPYKLTTFAALQTEATSSRYLYAIQGTVKAITKENNGNKFGTNDVVVQTSGGLVVASVNTIDPNTNTQSVDMSKFSLGTNVVVGGMYLGNISTDLLSANPELRSIGIPSSTPWIAGSRIEQKP